MKSLFSSPFVCATLLALTGIVPLSAQSITFGPGSISPTPTGISGFLNQYQSYIGGSTAPLSYPAFDVTVTGGADGGELLIGQSFLAICVNVSYEGLSAGDFALSTDGSSISYDIDGAGGAFGESWANPVSNTVKYNAMRDIMALHGSHLVSLDRNSAEFQYRITALNFLFAEIGVDGIADVDPLSTGEIRFSAGVDPAYADDFAAVVDYYNEYLGAIGSVEDNDYVLYAAGVTGFENQDVILIPVPEPTVAVLAGAAGLVGLVRRRRTA